MDQKLSFIIYTPLQDHSFLISLQIILEFPFQISRNLTNLQQFSRISFSLCTNFSIYTEFSSFHLKIFENSSVSFLKLFFFFCCARKTRQCTENWKLSFVRRVVLNGIKLEILKYLLHFNYVIIMRERVVQGCKWFTLPDGSRARNITSVKLHPT